MRLGGVRARGCGTRKRASWGPQRAGGARGQEATVSGREDSCERRLLTTSRWAIGERRASAA